MRYEITGTAADVWPRADIQAALIAAGASRVGQRRAFGRPNQPYVATFAAADDETAKALCEAARERLPSESSLPALLAWPYSGARRGSRD